MSKNRRRTTYFKEKIEDSMRIYIMGQVGSGKSTLAKKLSQEYQIPHYELDNIVWDDAKGTKRTEKDQQKRLKKILKQKSWIIEDVGRSTFSFAYTLCDVIYYIKLPKYLLYYRVIKR